MSRRLSTRRATVIVAAAAAGALALGAVAVPVAASVVSGGDASAITVRKDVKDLTPQEKKVFVNAIKKAKVTPNPDHPGLTYYDVFVQWHRNAFLCKNAWQQDGNNAGAAHNSPTFLPWHREYLQGYEDMLCTVIGDDSLALPYWDWTDPESTAAVFAPDFMGGNGDPVQHHAVVEGPFRKGQWEITIQDPVSVLADVTAPKDLIVRNFGTYFDDGIGLPTKPEVDEAIDVHRFDHQPFDANSPDPKSFRNTLKVWRDATPGECDEGWINVSQEPGGLLNADNGEVTMGTMAYNTSPNDPVFLVHHANVDRIFATWEQAQRQHYRPQEGAEQGWNGTDTMGPWRDRTINSWFGTLRIGYRYASMD